MKNFNNSEYPLYDQTEYDMDANAYQQWTNDQNKSPLANFIDWPGNFDNHQDGEEAFSAFTTQPQNVYPRQPKNQSEIEDLDWFERNKIFGPPHISDPQYLEYEIYNKKLNESM